MTGKNNDNNDNNNNNNNNITNVKHLTRSAKLKPHGLYFIPNKEQNKVKICNGSIILELLVSTNQKLWDLNFGKESAKLRSTGPPSRDFKQVLCVMINILTVMTIHMAS